MGFASGFQVGASAVERGLKMREEQELKRGLAQAYAQPTTSQGYTAETGQQLEELAKTGAYDIVPQYAPPAEGQTQGMFTGYQAVPKAGLDLQGDMPAAPMAFNPQQVQEYGGRRVAGQFDPTQLQGLQAREAARVVGASGDYRGAAALQAEAIRMEREAEEAPLRRRALEAQVAGSELGLTRTRQELAAGDRTAAAAKRMDDFNAWRSQNPEADFAAINTEVQRLGMGVDEQFKVASNLTGISEQAFKASEQRIQKLIKNQGLDGLLEAHKTSNDLDPGSHFEVIRGKGGALSLNRVDTATGKIIQPNVFSGNEAETVKYLNTAAAAPSTIIDYTMNLEKAKLAMERDRAAIDASRAQTREAGRSPVEKNLATLQRLGIAVSPEDVRAMAGIKQEKLSPEAAARLEVITANVKGNDSPKALAEAQAAITDLFRGEALNKRNATIVKGLQTANTKNDLPAAIKQLRDAGVGDETIVGLARQAGVTLPANFAPAAPPAAPAAAPVSPRTGLSTGAQQQYGPLTPRATIEADARAGVPAAIAYLRQQAEYARNLELARTENAMRAMQGE